MIMKEKNQNSDITSGWSFRRGECVGGNGDYSYGFKYYIMFNGEDVLSFEVSVYEKTREEQPVSITIINDDPLCVMVKAKSFYDNFVYLTRDGGRTWVFQKSEIEGPVNTFKRERFILESGQCVKTISHGG